MKTSDELIETALPFSPAFTRRWELVNDMKKEEIDQYNSPDDAEILLEHSIYTQANDTNFSLVTVSRVLKNYTRLIGRGEIGTQVVFEMDGLHEGQTEGLRRHRFGAPAFYEFTTRSCNNGEMRKLHWYLDGHHYSPTDYWGMVIQQTPFYCVKKVELTPDKFRYFFNPIDNLPCPKHITVTWVQELRKYKYQIVWYLGSKRVSMKKYWFEVEKSFDVFKTNDSRLFVL